MIKIDTDTVADGYLAVLRDKGVDFLFANGGTDFAPLAESYARATVTGDKLPTPVSVPHENVAVAMAHGNYLISGRPQAVMVHVNVGTANALCGVINAASDNIPIFMTAGRSPLSEFGNVASRDGVAQWAQEMYDQGGLLRECVKWDYELRFGEQVASLVERALAIAMAEPRGPIYLTLPREVLCEPLDCLTLGTDADHRQSSRPGPELSMARAAAEMIANAERPLIITRTHGGNRQDSMAVADFAAQFAIPVIEYRPLTNALASDHPMLLGYDPAPYLGEADVILVVENDVPWLPAYHDHPDAACRVIHIGVDPLFLRIPTRGFRPDILISSSASEALARIAETLEPERDSQVRQLAGRKDWVAGKKQSRDAQVAGLAREPSSGSKIDLRWATICLDRAVPDDALLFNEYPLVLDHLTLRQPHCYFGMPAAGGLGWALGAALGAKLAAPDRFVVAAIGDGSYMLGVPTAAHFVSEAYDLPILFVVFNNASWQAVPRSTRRIFPDGYAARSGVYEFTSLAPSPRFDKLMAAFDGHGEFVTDPTALPDALERAVHFIRTEGKQALVNISVE